MQPTLGALALFLTLQESLSLVCALLPEHGCNMKAFLHRSDGEKGKPMETGTRELAAMGKMRMFTLWGYRKAQQEWSQHLPHSLVGNLDYKTVSLTKQCFLEIVKDQISDFSLSTLVKISSINVNFSLHYNDTSQAFIHWQIMLYDITRAYTLHFVLLDWNIHEPFYSSNTVTKPMIENLEFYFVLELLYISSVLKHRNCIILFSTKERQFHGPVPSKSS